MAACKNGHAECVKLLLQNKDLKLQLANDAGDVSIILSVDRMVPGLDLEIKFN